MHVAICYSNFPLYAKSIFNNYLVKWSFIDNGCFCSSDTMLKFTFKAARMSSTLMAPFTSRN